MIEEHELNQLILDNLPSVIYLCQIDAAFTPLSLQGQVEAMFGYRFEDFIEGKITIPGMYHPDERELIYSRALSAAKERRAYHLVHRMQHRDGHFLWVESIGRMILDENDPERTLMSGFLLDVTERKKIEDEHRKLSEIVRHSPASVVMTDLSGKIEYVNPKFEEVTGYAFDEVIGKSSRILKSGHQSKEYYQTLWNTILAGHDWNGEFANIKKDGELYWELASISPILNDAGEIESFVAIKEDITERKLAEQALELAKQALEKQVLALEQRNRETALFSEMQAALLNCGDDLETYQVLADYAGQLFPDVSGSLYETVNDGKLNRLIEWGGMCSRTVPDFPFLDQSGRQVQSPDEVTKPFLADCYIGEDENLREQKSLCIPLYSQGLLWGVFQLLVLPGQKIREIQQLALSVVQQFLLTVENLRLREELRNQAVRDSLTGLYNRRYLEAALERELSRAKRKELSVGVIMLDIDHFKQFNDQFGHDVGDIVLRQIGLFLHDSVRGGDVACRYGGEEFLVILPEISLEDAVQRAKALRIGVEKLNEKEYRTYPGRLSISLGVAMFPQHGNTGREVMQAADQAMYQAKREGRNLVRIFEG